MSRKPKRSESTAGEHSDAFPSNPRRPPIIGIYITHDDKSGVINYVSFSKQYSAAAFIQDVIEKHGRPDHDKTPPAYSVPGIDLIFEAGWRLSTRGNSQVNDLGALVKYRFTSKEAEFTIPDELKSHFSIFSGRDKPIEDSPDGTVNRQDSPGLLDKARTGARTPRASRDDLVTLASFAKDAGEARQLLRKANFPKPDTGWAWPANHPDIAKVKKLLKVS